MENIEPMSEKNQNTMSGVENIESMFEKKI